MGRWPDSDAFFCVLGSRVSVADGRLYPFHEEADEEQKQGVVPAIEFAQ